MKKNIKIVSLVLISSFLLVMLSACSDKSDDIPTFSDAPTVVSLVAEGWSEFRAKRFDVAADLFVQANERDATNLDSYIGLGWSYSMLKSFLLAKANFSKALTFGSSDMELVASCYAGLAAVELANNNWQTAIDNVDKALAAQPDFLLADDNTIDKDDLYLLKAQAYFELDKFYKSAEMVEMLSPGFLSGSNIINESESLNPTILSTTATDGVARIAIPDRPGTPAVPVNLVYVESLTNQNVASANIKILDMADGSNVIEFFGNPIPQATDVYDVDYYYAVDFGLYIADLSVKLQDLKEQLK